MTTTMTEYEERGIGHPVGNPRTENWMSRLMKDVLSGKKLFVSQSEKISLEKEMSDWSLRTKLQNIKKIPVLTNSERSSLEFEIRLQNLRDLEANREK